MRMIVFANCKGGVGKTTLAVHLAAWLADLGHRVALLDTDSQRSSSQWAGELPCSLTIRTATSPEEVVDEVTELRDSHDFLVADGPAGLDDQSRMLLLLADLVLFPISPSILDVRSVVQATTVLKCARKINQGRPEARLILNRMRARDTISRELAANAPELGLTVCQAIIRDLRAFRDAAQQGTTVQRMGKVSQSATEDVTKLFGELLAAPGNVQGDHPGQDEPSGVPT